MGELSVTHITVLEEVVEIFFVVETKGLAGSVAPLLL